MEFYHSVTLDEEKCVGCTNCVRRCPTEAIRVRGGKAKIIPEKCIDCGQCIRTCTHHAKKAVYDDISEKLKYKYNIALPAPALYGQFNNLEDIDYVLTGILNMGFDAVFEVSRAAEVVSDYTRKLLATDKLHMPVISSACPAVVRLIRVRFPELCKNVLPVLAPVEIAAKMAREEAIWKTGLKAEDIGVFFISPCPAKVTAVKSPIDKTQSEVNGVLSISAVYKKLVSEMNNIKTPKMLAKSGVLGISWATSGGEAAGLLKDKYLAADGIENVIKVLEEIEDDKLKDIEFIELNACTAGCVGGVLAVENPFVAKARIASIRRYLPISKNKHNGDNEKLDMHWHTPLLYVPILQLDNDMNKAITMLSEIEEITKSLPSLDCGSCGAPTCRALAEDIVKGEGRLSDCIFKFKEEIAGLFREEEIK